MKLQRLLAMFCACLTLTGCATLLEREYHKEEPHSSKFWESEAAGTLRAENYQDIVNDLLLLVGQHTEKATVRLYTTEDDVKVGELLEQATTETLQETPLGAYAVEYITSSSQAQRGYYDLSIQIEYRRTAEQIQAVVNATSVEALYSLLNGALDAEQQELAVRVGYWKEGDQAQVEATVEQIRTERALTDTPAWTVSYYPNSQEAGLVEFILVPETESGELSEKEA